MESLQEIVSSIKQIGATAHVFIIDKEKNGMSNLQHVFLVGAKSLGAYGGYETFINKLTEYHQDNKNIKYHVACKANGPGCMDERTLKDVTEIKEIEGKGGQKEVVEFTYHNAHCFKIHVPEKLGSAQAIYYDVVALKKSIEIIEKNGIEHPIVYIMACRIGAFIRYYYKKIHNLGGEIYLNPDGHEWMRAKWSKPIKMYWKKSEEIMVRNADLVICDSMTIEKYIKESYGEKTKNASHQFKTTYIAYGAETRKSTLSDDSKNLLDWYERKGLAPHNYYLVVGRFVPENNYETMIREFMKSKSTKNFAIITNVNQKLLKELEEKLGYRLDKRIKFVGTVYDEELLKKIRENAYGYFHGHEVGGTNPSLLEALESTDLNLLLDVSFNHEVAEDSALYWSKEDGSLSSLVDKVDLMNAEEREALGEKAKKRIAEAFSWEYISGRYEKVFTGK